MTSTAPRPIPSSGFTLMEIVVSVVILAVLAGGFLSVVASSRYLVSRQKRRLAAYEEARRRIEVQRQFIGADNWYSGAGDPLRPTGVWTAWGNAVTIGGVVYSSRTRIDQEPAGCADCPRRVTVQVRWNEIQL